MSVSTAGPARGFGAATFDAFALHSKRALCEGALVERWVTLERGHIASVGCEEPSGLAVHELGDAILAPGLVDTHIHGYAGVDALTCTSDELMRMGKALAQAGTTSWLATFPAAPAEVLDAACAKAAQALEEGCPGLKGVYLEGPFLAHYRAGAQNREYLVDPSLELLDRWQELAQGSIRKAAVAPELDGALEFIQGCVKRGIVCAIGHSEASYDEVCEALDAGASVFVHTYNAMSVFHHREPGFVGAALTCDGTFCELIGDESHVDRVACDILLRARKWQEVALVTDCLSPAGTLDGKGTLGGMPVSAQGNVCHISGGHMLAGTVVTMREVAAQLTSWGIAAPEQALCMASEVPAHSTGLYPTCGAIVAGAPADLLALDGGFGLLQVYQGGRRVL